MKSHYNLISIPMKNFTCFLKITILTLLLAVAGVNKIQAQDNTGKEFWFTLFAETYLDHLPGVYIVGYYDCTVTIDYVARDPLLDPAGDPECTRHTVNVVGGVPLYVDIPYDLQALCWRYADNLTTPETIQNNGIRVTSTAPIALYSQFFAAASSEMTPILPVEEMGTEYIATAYREITAPANEFNARASITGIEDNTSITFTLPTNCWTSSTNINGATTHGPGSSWTITLNKGQTYTVLSNDNGMALATTPAGSSVTVNNNQGLNGLKIVANKKISVMGGTDCTWVGNDEYPGCGACDLTSTHLKPVSQWKTRYISTQTLQRPNQMSLAVGLAATPNIEPFPAGFNDMSVADYLLITAKDNGTVVNISGQATYTKNLSAGQWFIYESPGNSNPLTPPPTTSPGMSNHVIQSNNPIQVIQMMKGWQCDNNNPADPTQMLVIDETMWRDNYIVTNPTQYANNFFVFIVKEPSGTNVARNSLSLEVAGTAIAIPTGNSPTNDGTLGWSRMGTVEPYYYQRVNIAAGGAIRAKSVPLVAGGTTYPFAFYASGSTNASSYGYMGGAVCRLRAFAHADTANICLGTPVTFKLDSTQNGGTVATTILYDYTWTMMNGATTVYTFTGSAAADPTHSYTPATAGTYTGYLDITDNAGCTARDTFMIVVNATIPAPTAAASLTVCEGQNINLTSGTSVTGVTYSWTGPAGFTSALQNPVITGATAAMAGTYSVTISKNTCTSLPATTTVIITPNPAVTLTSAAGTNTQTVCNGAAITNITYSITNATGATISGLPAGVTGSFAGGTFTISGTASATGTFNYTISTTGGCSVVTANGSITVNPNAAIALTSAAATNAQSVCVNTAISNITYSITGGGTGATVTGLPAGINGSFAGGIFTISGTPTAAGAFNYTITTTGTCTQTTAIGSITVNPNATITLTSAAGTNAQTVCIGNALTTITYSIGGGGTGATVSGLPGGLTGTYAGGIFTISGSPSVAGTFNYTVNTTGTCVQTSATGSIVVNPNGLITLTSAAGTNIQTVCLTAPVTNITYSVTGGATGATVTGLPAGVTGSFAAGTFTISGTPSATGTFNYTVTTTGVCAAATATGSIIVNPNAAITLTSAAGTNGQTICLTSPITNITYSVTGGGTGATVTGLPAGVTGSFAGGIVTISGTPSATGTFNYTVNTTGTCTQTSATGSITVDPPPVITSVPTTNETSCGAGDGTITINATGSGLTYSINGGSTFAATNNFTGLAGGSYNIMVVNSAGCSVSGGTVSISSAGAPPTPIANASPNPLCEGATLTLSVASPVAGETYNWSGPGAYTATGTTATITNITTAMSGLYTVTATVGGCVSPGGSISVTVNPNAAITLNSTAGTDAQTICANTAITTITYSVSGGGTGAAVSGLPAGLSGSFAGGVFTISGTPTVTGTFNYTVSTAGTCLQSSATGSIIINPDATITLTSAAGTNTQTICSGDPVITITYSVTGGGTGASVTGLPAGLTGSFSAGVFTISGTPTASGTSNYTVTTSGTCLQQTATGSITVNPNATVVLTSAAGTDAQTVCINTAITTITYSVSGGATGASVSGLPAGVTSSFAGGILIISGTPTATGPFNYSINTTGSCAPASSGGNITVNPDAAIALTSAAGTDAQTLCVSNAIASITYSVTGGGTGATVTGLPAGLTSSFAAGVFTITGNPSVAGVFNYTVNTTGTCVQTSSTGSITVDPNVTVVLSSAAGTDAQSLCISTAITDITYSVTGGTGAGVTGLPTGVTGSYSAGVFTISGTPTASGTFNYTITSTGGCNQSATGSITVDPLPVISSVPFTNETSCGAGDGTITVNATGTGLTYSINGGTAFSASNMFTGLTGGSYDIVVQNSAGCSISGGTVSISSAGAPAIPTANASPNPICEGTTLTLSVSTVVAGETYTWTGPGLATPAIGSTITIPAVTTSMSGTYNVTANTGGCSSPAGTVVVTVDPNATIALTSGAGTNIQLVCVNTTITTITYSVSGGGTNATATGLPAGLTGTYAGATFTISGTPTVTGTFNYTVTTTGTCAQTSTSGTITVNPDAVITLTSGATSASQTLCTGNAIANITYNVTGGGTGATATGLPAGVTGSFSSGVFTISGTPSVNGTFNYTVNTTGTCAQVSATGTITINPDAVITLASTAATTAQTICEGTPITNISYSISGGGTGATVTGLPAGVTGTYAGGTFTISGTPTVDGLFNYTVNTTGTCLQVAASGTISIDQNAVIALTSAPGTTAQVLCQGSTIADITYAISGGGTGGTVTGLPSGLAGTFAFGVFTISGTPTVSGPFSYTVNTTGTCLQTNATGSITINPLQNASFSYPASSFCQSAANPTPTITGVAGGNFTFSPGGLTINSATGAITLSTSTINTYTITYTTPGPCPNSSSAVVSISTNPTATASATTTVCSGESINFTSSGGGTYTWDGPVSYNSNLQNPVIDPASVANSGTYTLTVNNGGCTDTAQVNVVVTATPSADAGTDATIELGTSLTLDGSGGTAFNWTPAAGLSCTNCENPVATPVMTTTYCLETSNGSCTSNDCVTITVKTPCNVNDALGVPNAFSPNGDGNNDEFCLQGWSECMDQFSVLIFDRWGEKMFEGYEADFCWDGTFRGKTLDPAVFVYFINATFSTGESIVKKGNISIIR
jgi:gliding motility-associated-like protein